MLKQTSDSNYKLRLKNKVAAFCDSALLSMTPLCMMDLYLHMLNTVMPFIFGNTYRPVELSGIIWRMSHTKTTNLVTSETV